MARNGSGRIRRPDLHLHYIAIVVAGHAYGYLKRLQREERERYEYQQALVASEPHSLKAQLRPHFLFNPLHRIATLVDGDSKNAHADHQVVGFVAHSAGQRQRGSNLFAGRAEICQGIPGSGKDALRQAPPDRMAGCSRDQMGCWYRR
jgi:Histidine kinase